MEHPAMLPRNAFLMPCCVHADIRPKRTYAVGSHSDVAFHTQPNVYGSSFPLLFERVCLFEWLHSSSSWEVAVLNRVSLP